MLYSFKITHNASLNHVIVQLYIVMFIKYTPPVMHSESIKDCLFVVLEINLGAKLSSEYAFSYTYYSAYLFICLFSDDANIPISSMGHNDQNFTVMPH